MKRIGAGVVAAAMAWAGAVALAADPPRTSISLDRSTIWQDAPDQLTGLTVLSVSRDYDSVSVVARLGLVDDRSAPEPRAWGIANPVVGAVFRFRLSEHVLLSLLGGTTVPVGSGGGDGPARPETLRAMLNGTDWGGPMFGPDHLDVYEGFRLTGSARGFTLRLRSTLHPAVRVRGAKTDPLGPRVIFTSSGLLAGYAPGRRVSVFAELAETRFLNTPPFLVDTPDARVDRYAVAGVSLDLRLGANRFLQPTLSLAKAIDAPKTRRSFRLVEVELVLTLGGR